MSGQEVSFVVVWMGTAVLTLTLALLAWERRSAPGARAFALLMVAAAWWAATRALALSSSTLSTKLFWQQASFLSVASAPLGWLAFVLRFIPGHRRLRLPELFLLAIVPAITTWLVWTNGESGWVWRSVRLNTSGAWPALELTLGTWFWVHTLYSGLLCLLGLGLLLRAWGRGAPEFRRRALGPLLGAVVMLAGGVGSLTSPYLTEVSLLVAMPLISVIAAWTLLRYRLFDLKPVAREAMTQSIADGVLVLDNQGLVVDINPSAELFLGRQAARVLGRPVGEVFAPYARLTRPADAASLRAEVTCGKGTDLRYVDLSLSTVQDDTGQPAGELLVLRDVTARKQAEQTLERRAEELAALQATVLEMATAGDLPALLQGVVERAVRLLHGAGGGLYLCDAARQEVRCVVSYLTRGDYTGVVLKYGEGAAGMVAQSGKPLIVNDYRAWPGRAAVFEQDGPFGAVLSVPMIWQERVIGVLHVLEEGQDKPFTPEDVELLSLFASHAAIAVENARLHAETQRRLRELEMLYDASTNVLGTLELGTRLQLVMDAAVRAVPAAQRGWLHLWDEQRQQLVVEAVHGFGPQVLEPATLGPEEGYTGWVYSRCEPAIIPNVDTDPRSKPIRVGEIGEIKSAIAAPLCAHDRCIGVLTLHNIKSYRAFDEGDLRSLSAFANQAASALENSRLYQARERELAERQRAEEALRQSEARYRAIVQDQTEIIARFLPDGTATFVNDAGVRFMQDTPEGLLGHNISEGLSPDELPKAHQLLASLTAQSPAGEVEIPVLVRGEQLWVHWTIRAIWDELGQVAEFQCVGRDITRRKHAEQERARLEEQLRQAQKMEAVGLLAGGVAHDFNNFLLVMRGNAELALAQVDATHPLYQSLAAIEEASGKAALLTRQLLVFSRRQPLQRRALNLSDSIAHLAGMLGRVIGERIELSLNLTSEGQLVWADPMAVEQMLVNLVLNARDAMPEGGRLTIETARLFLDETFCAEHPQARPGDYVRLSVADTGIGLPDLAREHLFEPFFTTKDVGQGTGLGLAVVYGLVKQHEGWIEVGSGQGQGTRFDLYLPVYRGLPAEETAAGPLPPAVPRGSETILVAEDEPAVLDLVRNILEGLGYAVLSAADGHEAVLAFGANQERVELVILDARMPGLSGPQAYEVMRARRPDLPVLFITGYALDKLGMPTLLQVDAAVLAKPFTAADLGQRVRQLLDGGKEGQA